MTEVRVNMMVSLDGYAAGPDQSTENPFGVGGMALSEWLYPLRAFKRMHGEEGGLEGPSNAIVDRWSEGIGATVMGRNMFEPGGSGPWGEDPYIGIWGSEPPYRHPVFVLTHHAREPLEMENGTRFHFVTDGIESALEQARAAAGEKDVNVGGGAEVVRQYLAAGLLDRIEVALVPVLLGSGARPFDNLEASPPSLEQIEAIAGSGVTHITYRLT